MPKSAKKKKVLITGCSSGFGLLTALGAAKAGYEVVATMRNLAKVDTFRDALAREHCTATIEELDVASPQSIEAVTLKHPDVDILVNNAGILILGSFLDLTDEEVRRIFETNYFGVVALTRSVAAGMVERRSGLIINVASLAGLVGHMYNSAYSASKHALVGFSRSIKLELRPFNVKVVSVEPGYHKTEMIRSNANLSENFYNSDSITCTYNRAFLRLMHDEIVPRAAQAQVVANKIVNIMGTKDPKRHYVIGRDATMALRMQWLGLGKWLEQKVYSRLKYAMRRERFKAESRKRARRKHGA